MTMSPPVVSPRTVSSDPTLRRGAGVAALMSAGLLHAFITPDYLEEKLYIGASFGVSFLLCSIVSVWLWRRHDRRAWIAGALLCAGMIAGFLLSRTVGLPGFDESGVWAHWTEGFPALAAECAFLWLAVRAILSPAPTPTPTSTPEASTHPMPAPDPRDLVRR